MLQKTLTCLLIAAVFHFASGKSSFGNKITDSISALISTLPPDTSKALALSELSFQLISINAEEALKYAREAIALSGKLNYAKGTATGYSRLALAYKLLTKYDSAFYYFKKSSALFADLGSTEGQISALSNIGTLYNRIGSFDSAAHYLFLSLHLAEAIRNKELQGSALNSIGLVMQDQEKYDEAIDYFQRSLRLNEETGKRKSAALSCENLGNTYSLKGDNAAARSYYDKAMVTYVELEDKRSLGRININLSELFRKQGRFKEASASAMQAADLYQQVKNPNGTAHSFLALAEISMSIKNNNDAAKYSLQALAIAMETGNRQIELQCYELLHKIYSSLGNYRKAYEYMGKESAMNDSLFNIKKETIVSELQTKYETEKKENEIKLLSKDKELSDAKIRRQETVRNSMIAGTLMILIIGFLIFNRYRSSQNQKRQAERMRISSDLHDEIGSTLSSISMYSAYAKEKPADAVKALEEISSSSQEMIGDMSDIIWAINPRNDSFAETIARLRSYAAGLAQSKNILLDFRNDDTLQDVTLSMEQRKNLFLICKEAINNSVKYSGCKTLSVSVHKNKKKLSAQIMDDGIGFDTSAFMEGNGLKNMKQRAAVLQAVLSIHSEIGNGTRLNLEMNL